MTTEETIRILEERDGLTSYIDGNGDRVYELGGKSSYARPDYPNSHDAIHGVIEKLTEKEKLRLGSLLDDEFEHGDIIDYNKFLIWFLTLPAQTLAPLVAQAIEDSNEQLT